MHTRVEKYIHAFSRNQRQDVADSQRRTCEVFFLNNKNECDHGKCAVFGVVIANTTCLILLFGGRANLLQVRHVEGRAHAQKRFERETLGLQTLLAECRRNLRGDNSGWNGVMIK